MKYIIIFLTITFAASGKVKLPALTADGMLLQRDKPITLWGWAEPGETINISFQKKNYQTIAETGGTWKITIPAQPAGGPHTITVNDQTVNNIMIGDLWLCSGQSNMETPVPRLMTLYGDEIRNYTNRSIRYVKLPVTFNFHQPQQDTPPAQWLELTPENAMAYAGIPYFFAKTMFEHNNIPTGIINASAGGTPIEAWMPEESLANFPAIINDKRMCESDEYVKAMQQSAAITAKRYAEVMTQEDRGINSPIHWSKTTIDDTDWPSTEMFDNSWAWNKQQPIFGTFWLRQHINIPDTLASQAATLYMGRIEGADSVYINGKFVGNTTYQYPPRIYAIPPGTLQPGQNLIVARISGGAPSFVKDKPYKLVFQTAAQEIPLAGTWKYRTGVIMPPPEGTTISFAGKPTGLYNAMIAPLQPWKIKGIIWYQGESNTGRHHEYHQMLTALIHSWRNLWNPETPFLVVQLPNYMEPGKYNPNSAWAEMRNIQRQVAHNTQGVQLAVTIDLGEWNDVHPLNKKDVANRLALLARKFIYGEKTLIAEGPVFTTSEIQGNTIILSFADGTNDLLPVDHLRGFFIAGADGIYKEAKATITEGSKVIVQSKNVPQPLHVRYAWANNPQEANLRNRSGLPASPFTTE
ncbi:MAG: sialate O-acetylesterase [Tannerellaceae bacterium]|nr:sialate O-acetylesterase [Tannerellaceae bacterium]